MKRVQINTPYDPTIQVPSAIVPEMKQQELDDLLRRSDKLAEDYFKERKNPNSIAFKDKQLSAHGLVLFDRGYEVVTYRYFRGGRDFVAQYEEEEEEEEK